MGHASRGKGLTTSGKACESPGVELVVSPAGEVRCSARAVDRRVACATLSVALDADGYVVQSERAWPRSPLEALLGIIGRDSATPRLELAECCGVDWTGRELREGHSLTGRAVVELVDQALAAREGDLRWLRDAAHGLLGPWVASEAELETLFPTLDQLVRGVQVATVVDVETGWPLPGYMSADPVALAAVEILERGRLSHEIHECAHCGAGFFAVERADELYCRRAAPGEPPGGRTCRQVGPQTRYAANLDELGRCYRRNYKRLDQRARRGAFSRTELDRWRTGAQELLAGAERRRWTVERLEAELAKIEPKGD